MSASPTVRAVRAPQPPPPQELDAEAAVLSAILLDPERLTEVRPILRAVDFYADANRHIYEAILAVHARGVAVDIVPVSSELLAQGRLEQIGGTPYLAQLSDATPAVAHVADHAQLVRSAAVARVAAERCARAAIELRAGGDGAVAAILELSESLRSMATPANGAAPATEAWPEFDADGIFAPLEPVKYLLAPLDICPGAPVLVAGYGFSGKTVAVQSLAVSLAAGLPVWGCYAAPRARVLHIDYEQGPRLTRERYQRLAAALVVGPADIAGHLALVSIPQLYIDSALTEGFLVQKCTGFDLAIIDSLRAACPTLEENDSAVRGVLDMLTRVSVKTGCTFVVIHHARKPSQNATGGAKMAIRGSGAIFDACGSVLVFEAEKGQPTRVAHEKARTSGICADDFQLVISDFELDGNPRGGLLVTAEGERETRAEQSGGKALDALKERVRAYFREHGDQLGGKVALRERLGVNRDSLAAALAELEGAGEIINTGTAQRPVLHFVEVGK